MKQISLLRNAFMVGCITVLAASATMASISGVSVKADTTNTSSVEPAFSTGAVSGYDNLWGMKDWGNGVTALTSYARFIDDNGWQTETCPAITTVVTGLDAAKTYDVYVQLLVHPEGFWGLYANLNWAPNTFLGKSNTSLTGLNWAEGSVSEYKLGTISGANSFAVNVDDNYDAANYSISAYYGVSYKDVTPAVPEPSALVALSTGLFGILGFGKRFAKK